MSIQYRRPEYGYTYTQAEAMSFAHYNDKWKRKALRYERMAQWLLAASEFFLRIASSYRDRITTEHPADN